MCTDLSGIPPRFLRLSLSLFFSHHHPLPEVVYAALAHERGKTISRFPATGRSSSGPVSRRRRVARSPLRPPRNPRINSPESVRKPADGYLETATNASGNTSRCPSADSSSSSSSILYLLVVIDGVFDAVFRIASTILVLLIVRRYLRCVNFIL